jgi:hypothetical protein
MKSAMALALVEAKTAAKLDADNAYQIKIGGLLA